jgi:hypothetical protein
MFLWSLLEIKTVEMKRNMYDEIHSFELQNEGSKVYTKCNNYKNLKIL